MWEFVRIGAPTLGCLYDGSYVFWCIFGPLGAPDLCKLSSCLPRASNSPPIKGPEPNVSGTWPTSEVRIPIRVKALLEDCLKIWVQPDRRTCQAVGFGVVVCSLGLFRFWCILKRLQGSIWRSEGIPEEIFRTQAL